MLFRFFLGRCGYWYSKYNYPEKPVVSTNEDAGYYNNTIFKLGSSLGWGLSGSGKKTSFSKKNASTLGA